MPADVTIPRLPWVPVYVERLWSSDFFAVATDAEFRAAFCLWLKSWAQRPPGSLPNDDRLLCRLAELGNDLDKWKKVKRIALRHWIRCTDGRLYHPVVAELVIEAFEKLSSNKRRTAAATAARWNSTKPDIRQGKRDGNRSGPKGKANSNNINLSYKDNNTSSAPARNGHAPAHETNGHDFSRGNLVTELGRCAPLRAIGAPLRSKRKELLRQKLLRFADATMHGDERKLAISGLCGGDSEHSEQWWLDRIDAQMRARNWNDVPR